MEKNINRQTLTAKIIVGLENQNVEHDQPPRKRIVVKLHMIIIFPYSAKKNDANAIALYSTLYPATNSASASGRSNGVLFVSAREPTRKIAKSGNRGKINQTSLCALTIS